MEEEPRPPRCPLFWLCVSSVPELIACIHVCVCVIRVRVRVKGLGLGLKGYRVRVKGLKG